MGVALARYYQLETRALQAMVAALEPRPRGRQESPQAREQKAAAQARRLERELHRYQALYRTVQKALGVTPATRAGAEEKGTKRKRRMRKATRGERVAKSLVERATEPDAAIQASSEGSVPS